MIKKFPKMEEVSTADLRQNDILMGWWDGVCQVWHVRNPGGLIERIVPIESSIVPRGTSPSTGVMVMAGHRSYYFDDKSRLVVDARRPQTVTATVVDGPPGVPPLVGEKVELDLCPTCHARQRSTNFGACPDHWHSLRSGRAAELIIIDDPIKMQYPGLAACKNCLGEIVNNSEHTGIWLHVSSGGTYCLRKGYEALVHHNESAEPLTREVANRRWCA